MSSFYDLSKTPRNILNQAIVRAIISENNGVWLDASDMSTMYQDSAGTTPVTAMEQPVGKWLDKSGNGNHATQSITASRPVISARKNLLTKTEDFADAAWVKYLMASVADNVFIPSTSSGVHFIEHPANISYVAGVKYTLSVRVKRKELTKIGLFFPIGPFDASGRHAWFDLVAGIVGGYQSGVTARISPHQSGGFLCSITCTAVSTLMASCGIYNTEGGFGDTIVGDGTSGVYVYYLQLEYGPVATRYQRVNTATDYDTYGFARYLKFDGVDDYLRLPYMGLYENGSASIITGSALLLQAANACTLGEGNTADADSLYCISRQLAAGGNLDSAIIRDDATTLLDTTGSASALAYGVASVRAAVDAGVNVKLHKNSQQLTSDSYTRSGVVTLNTTTIGAKVGKAATLFNNLMLYGLIVSKSAISDSDRRKCEVYLGRKAGVQL